MADTLDSIRKQVRDRLKELAPLVEEYRQLEEAMSALDGRASSAAPAPRSARSSSAPKNGGGPAKRGRRKGSGTRAGEALKLVGDRPGITIGELAEAMGIQQNYLYRVMPSLADEGKVVKSGRGWHLREPQADA